MTQPYADWLIERRCTSKQRHESQYDANTVVLHHWRHGEWAWRYECEHCGGWHITTDKFTREVSA